MQIRGALALGLILGNSLALLYTHAQNSAPGEGLASWYGESHRGKIMANGRKFDPEKFTAASWFYDLGTIVRVTLRDEPQRSVLVSIADRGPAKEWVRQGRIIDLSHAAFKALAPPDLGLVSVCVQSVPESPKSAVIRESLARSFCLPVRKAQSLRIPRAWLHPRTGPLPDMYKRRTDPLERSILT